MKVSILRRKTGIVGAMCLLLFLTPPYVLAGSAIPSLDKTVGTIGESFQLSIVIEGSLDGDVEVPEIPDVTTTATGSSTQISWINGVYKKEVSYNFILDPQKEGTYTIPALKLKIDGDWIRTQPLTFQVGSGGTANQADQDERLPSVFIERDFSKASLVEGEPVVSTVKIYHRVELAGIEAVGEKLSGVRVIDLKQYKTQEQKGPYLYNVIVYKQVLIPGKSGQIHLPPFRIKASIVMPREERKRRRRGIGDIDDFFGDFFGHAQGRVVNRTISSEAAILDVSPVAENRPKGYRGLVGNFRLKSDLSQTSLKVGDTTTLTLVLDGVGTLDVFGKWNLDLGPNIKIYADQPQNEEEVSEKWGLVSKRTFKFALVPTRSGDIVLPDVVISYFDPEKRQFEELRASLGTLKVEGGEAEAIAGQAQEAPSVAKSDVRALATDLVDMHRTIPLEKGQALTNGDYLLVAGMVGTPALLSLVVFLFRWATERERDMVARRRSRAFRTFRNKKEKLEREGREGVSDALAQGYLLFREYVGDKFNQQGSALTLKEIESILSNSRLNRDITQKAVDLLKTLESWEYGGKTLDQDQTEWMGIIENVVREIEDKC